MLSTAIASKYRVTAERPPPPGSRTVSLQRLVEVDSRDSFAQALYGRMATKPPRFAISEREASLDSMVLASRRFSQ